MLHLQKDTKETTEDKSAVDMAKMKKLRKKDAFGNASSTDVQEDFNDKTSTLLNGGEIVRDRNIISNES